MHRGPKKQPFRWEVTLPNGAIYHATTKAGILSIIRKAFNNPENIQRVLDRVKNWILRYIPFRSGYLQDHLIQTLALNVIEAGTQVNYNLSLDYTDTRPKLFTGMNVRHAPPEAGYGEFYFPLTKEVADKMKIIKLTKNFNALYQLNDPAARSRAFKELSDYTKNTLKYEFQTYTKRIKIKAVAR